MTTSDARKRIRENAAQAAATPAPPAHRPTVLWQVDVMDEDIDLADPVQVAQAAYHRILSSRMLPVLRVLLADGTAFDVDLDSPREDAATIVSHTTPTPAPVAVPEGGWRDGDWFITDEGREVRRDSANEVWRWHEPQPYGARWTDDGVTDRVRSGRVRILHLAPRPGPVTASDLGEFPGDEPTGCCHTPGGRGLDRRGCHRCFVEGWRSEPVTAPLPSEAVEAVVGRWRGEHGWTADADGPVPVLLAEIEAALLPAADQRARDEGTVREEIAREIEADMNHDAVRNATLATAARIARGGTR